jgi:Domain of unknown function (DUF1883)/TIR domain
MNFIHIDLGHQQRGATVEVVLKGSAANVRLLDSSNFSSYRNGRNHRYCGGLVKRSPFYVTIPRSGHWHVAVDMQGLQGTVRAGARVLPRPLPEARSASSGLAAIADNIADFSGDGEAYKEHDVFISHATEDKDAVVRPLALALRQRGADVWYDDFEMRIGDSLRRKIDQGIARSRFGVVVLSPAFFAKNWPQYELDGLVTREMHGGRQLILPLWHKLSKDELMRRSPSLADKVALRTADLPVDEIADQIAAVVLETRES